MKGKNCPRTGIIYGQINKISIFISTIILQLLWNQISLKYTWMVISFLVKRLDIIALLFSKEILLSRKKIGKRMQVW